MRVLLVSQYFPPEPGATQNRLGAFANGLVERGHSVTVVCEQPCHPAGVFQEGFGRRPVMTERAPGLTIRRAWVATSPVKTTAKRLAFYGTFAAAAGTMVAAQGRHDVMLASSPPLPGVLAAAAVAHTRRLPFVVDVRDIWPAAAAALGELSEGRLMRAFERAERWLYRSAARVTATTRPFCRHIDQIAGRDLSVHLPNGALDSLIALDDHGPADDGRYRVGYAGNLGIAQGLGIVIDAAERLRHREDVTFVLMGAGPLEGDLRRDVERRKLQNVEFRGSVPVAKVGRFLQECDALLVPLRDHALFDDFIPSKLYDAMAVGRPAIVAARGEAPALVQSHGAGVVVPPEGGPELAEAVCALRDDSEHARELGQAGRRAARGFARSRQLELLEDVLTRAAGPRMAA